MKNLNVAAIVVLFSTSAYSIAGYSGTQEHSKTSVAQLKDLPDDSWVTLEGKLFKSLGGEIYLFSDTSGQVAVEIEQDLWRGITVGASDFIRIRGELDHTLIKTEIDVQSLEIVDAKSQSKVGFVKD
ncbi:YgiW/YdeI family stress tolerance OB fold protein [Aeromonas sanarellii]